MRPAGWRLKVQRRLWLPVGCTFAAKNEKIKTIKDGRFHRVRHVQKPRCTTFHEIL